MSVCRKQPRAGTFGFVEGDETGLRSGGLFQIRFSDGAGEVEAMLGAEPDDAVGRADRKHGREEGEEGIRRFEVTVRRVGLGQENLQRIHYAEDLDLIGHSCPLETGVLSDMP